MYKFHLKTFSWNIFCFVRNNLQQVIDLHLQSLLKIQKCIYSFICTFYDSPIATTRKPRAPRDSPRKMGQTPNCAICIYYTVVAHFSCRVQSYQNTTMMQAAMPFHNITQKSGQRRTVNQVKHVHILAEDFSKMI